MKKYDNLDGLRTFSAFGIILMHVLMNGNYWMSDVSKLQGTSVTALIFSTIAMLGNLVQLFFAISAFGMCCGYYNKIKNNEISLESFYKKRYIKILPFFGMLVLLDVVFSGFTRNSLIEGFSDITMLFGFLPNSHITVIGVGWALGVIFAFYIIFPFFVFMIWNKKRAWISLAVTLVMYYFCKYYFVEGDEAISCNLLRWLFYFVLGGIIYLYKDDIRKTMQNHKRILGVVVIASGAIWCVNKVEYLVVVINTIFFTSLMCYAISVKSVILSNKLTKFVSEISFEVYLVHMLIIKVLEKLSLMHIFENDILSYICASGLTISLAVVFAFISQKCISKLLSRRI